MEAPSFGLLFLEGRGKEGTTSAWVVFLTLDSDKPGKVFSCRFDDFDSNPPSRFIL